MFSKLLLDQNITSISNKKGQKEKIYNTVRWYLLILNYNQEALISLRENLQSLFTRDILPLCNKLSIFRLLRSDLDV